MKKMNKRPSVAQRIARGMAELEEAMETGKPLHELFTVRTVEIPDPSPYNAAAVRKTRSRLHVSQAVFAKLLGVSVELVQHWEQGVRVPRGAARRLLDEINRAPGDFLARQMCTSDPIDKRRAG